MPDFGKISDAVDAASREANAQYNNSLKLPLTPERTVASRKERLNERVLKEMHGSPLNVTPPSSKHHCSKVMYAATFFVDRGPLLKFRQMQFCIINFLDFFQRATTVPNCTCLRHRSQLQESPLIIFVLICLIVLQVNFCAIIINLPKFCLQVR